MKDVHAKFLDTYRKAINADLADPFDDNVFRVVAKITSGPSAFTGRKVVIDLGISEFVASLPVETAERLRKELDGEDDRSILPFKEAPR
jgi:hypothetical protein